MDLLVLRGTLGHSLYSGSSAGATVEEKLAGRAGVTVELGLLAVLRKPPFDVTSACARRCRMTFSGSGSI